MSGERSSSNVINGKYSLPVIILISILCWSITIIFRAVETQTDSVTAGLFYNLMQEYFAPVLLTIINYVLILGVGLLLLWLNQQFSIIRTRTLLPFLFYMLFITIDAPAFFSLEGNIATFFLLIIVFYFFKSYQSKRAIEEAFNIGLLLSLGSLFSGRLLFFIPIIWIGLAYVQALSARSFFASLVGISAPYWLVFCWFLYQKDIAGFTESFHSFFQIKPLSFFDFTVAGWLKTCFSGLITIAAVVNFRMHSFKDKIKTRVYFYLLLVLILYVSVFMFFGIFPISEYIGIYYFSVSLFAAHLFATVNTRLSNVFFYLFLITFIGLLFFDI